MLDSFLIEYDLFKSVVSIRRRRVGDTCCANVIDTQFFCFCSSSTIDFPPLLYPLRATFEFGDFLNLLF